MKICLNKGKDPNRDDEYGSNGYSALCRDHANQEGTQPHFSKFAEGDTGDY